MSAQPYYQDDSVTLYHGDCREILPELATVDLIVTDPPYRSLDANVLAGTTTRLVKRSGKRLAATDDEWFATLSEDEIAAILSTACALLSSSGAMYVFADVKTGLVLFPRLLPKNVLVWDKQRIGMGYSWRRMHEWIAYCPRPAHELRDQGLGDILRCPTPDDKCHPTEKPTGAIVPILRNSSDPRAVVLDPFAGSGAVLVAAKSMDRRAIGIELSERHCETIAQRLSQNVFDLGGAA